jgi:hypothetical protein
VKSTPNLKVMPPTVRRDLLIPIVYRASQSYEKTFEVFGEIFLEI